MSREQDKKVLSQPGDVIVTSWSGWKFNATEGARQAQIENTEGFKIFAQQHSCNHKMMNVGGGSIVAAGMHVCTKCGFSTYDDGHPEY